MRHFHLLAMLLCVSLGLADAVLAVQLESASSPVFLLLTGMTFGQLALLAIWCVLGTGPWPLRALAALPVAAGLSAPLASVTAACQSDWFVALGSFWLAVTLVLIGWQAGAGPAVRVVPAMSIAGRPDRGVSNSRWAVFCR